MPGERRQIAPNQRHAHQAGKGATSGGAQNRRQTSNTTQKTQRNYSITSHKSKTVTMEKPKTMQGSKSRNKSADDFRKEEKTQEVVEQNGAKTPEQEVEVAEDLNKDQQKNDIDDVAEQNGGIRGHTASPVEEDPDDSKEEKGDKWAEKASEEYQIKSFNDKILEYSEVFETDKFNTVDQDFPVEDLVSFVNVISGTIDEFKQQSQNSQKQLEDLCNKMRHVKENIHFSITKRQMELSPGR